METEEQNFGRNHLVKKIKKYILIKIRIAKRKESISKSKWIKR